jgi:hypothetical protein
LLKQEFIDKATAIHGDKYDYSLAEYGNNGREFRTTIICKIHGAFEQRPKNHLAGRGCNECTKGKSAEIKRLQSAELFVSKAEAIHGKKYDYSKSVYVNATSKLTVTCREHGDFEIKPNNHLYGKGCRTCGLSVNMLSIDEFVASSREVHGHKYDYSRVKLQMSCGVVEIICPDHGVFFQDYLRHTYGNGCPGCSKTGYDTTKSGSLYVLEAGNLTKIGITNRDVSKRVAQIKQNTGKKFSVVTHFNFDNGSYPLRLETTLLRELRAIYKQPTEKYDGSTESFFDVDVPKLLQRIRKLSEECV